MRRAAFLVIMFLAGADVVAQSHGTPAAHPAPASPASPGHAAPAAAAVTAKVAPPAHAAAVKAADTPVPGSDADLIRVAKAVADAVASQPPASARERRRPRVASRGLLQRYAVRWPTEDVRWNVAWPAAAAAAANELKLSWPGDVTLSTR